MSGDVIRKLLVKMEEQVGPEAASQSEATPPSELSWMSE